MQTTGWPGVVTVLGNWFGKSKRGLIFGIWNSHTSLGNILGTLIAATYVETDWGLSFMVPGGIMGLCGFIVFLFLAPNPTDVGCAPPASKIYRRLDNNSDEGVDCDSHDETSDCGEEASINPGNNVSLRIRLGLRLTAPRWFDKLFAFLFISLADVANLEKNSNLNIFRNVEPKWIRF